MRHVLLIFLFSMLPLVVASQDISKLTNLNDDIAETSGLIFFDDRLITHNDSGGMNALYEINTADGNINRTVTSAGEPQPTNNRNTVLVLGHSPI